MAWATVDEWLARRRTQIAKDLTVDPESLITTPDRDLIATALDDATAELSGYLPRIPESYQPGDDTKRIHCIKVATYLLTLDRAAKEWEQIRNAYTDTIAFYVALVDKASAEGGGGGTPPTNAAARIPEAAFTPSTLKGFV